MNRFIRAALAVPTAAVLALSLASPASAATDAAEATATEATTAAVSGICSNGTNWDPIPGSDGYIGIMVCAEYRPGPSGEAQGRVIGKLRVLKGTTSRGVEVTALELWGFQANCANKYTASASYWAAKTYTVPRDEIVTMTSAWVTMRGACSFTSYSRGHMNGYIGAVRGGVGRGLYTSDLFH